MRSLALSCTLIVLSLGAVAGTGCGTAEETPATTVVERVTVPAETTEPAASETTTDETPDVRDASAGGSDDASSGEESGDASEPGCTEVPDVVGLRDLQLSQDTLQASGFYVMDQEDATGQGRAQLLDRNWVVTRQDPKAGTCVPTSTTITTYAKKHGE